ncbi:hypothetical protein C7444_10482 [Sphaerotilus hippei]|uniref:Uncharacterized protein n=1 Tax=Sphaerotilus hippei TaxID=744406 RepID=A0A318H2C1_9BURK|nr:hypothetical protein [Sphaerotilus hippei]PXW97480.1 hypothetical protein C7444_10482 [Sphaerotilus hippei]
MQYRYTLTRRLLAVGTISLLLLLTLLFLLGVQIGRLMAEPGGPPAAPGLATFAPVVPEPLAVPAPPGAAAPDQRTALADLSFVGDAAGKTADRAADTASRRAVEAWQSARPAPGAVEPVTASFTER